MDSAAEPPVSGVETTAGTQAAGPSKRKRANTSVDRDPLFYLREFIGAKKQVHLQDDWLEFDDHKIHRSTKCGYVLQKDGPLLDIGSVWYMFHSTSADRRYTQASASGMSFTYIGIDRRGDLCDFLLGRSDSCNGLLKEVFEGRKRPREHAPRVPTKKASDISLGDLLSYEDVTKRVRAVQDLDVVIRMPGRLVPNANMILKIAQEEWQAFSSGAKQAAAPVTSKANTGSLQVMNQVPLHAELEHYLRLDEKNLPILLVPCNKMAPVNLLNVQELLQNGTYIKPDREHINFFESTRAESILVKRNIGGKLWTFEVRDSVKNFTKDQWQRTVLVITDGNEWQFKNWPFETVVDLFCTIRGVYFQDIGKPLPKHVYNWPCLKLPLPLNPEKTQHRFAQLRDEIFTNLEDFMNTSRPKKFVNESKLGGGRRIVENCLNVL